MQVNARPVASMTRAPGKLAAVVYEELRERLFAGAFRPGERLSVEALREEFSTSKQPVMEALRLLSADGLVEIVPQVGSRVCSYSTREIVDFYTLFADAEATVAAAAAERRREDQIAVLDGIAAELDTLTRSGDGQAAVHGYRDVNRRTHEQIHRMAHSALMMDLSRRFWDMSDFLIGTHGAPPRTSAHVARRQDEHHGIRDAIADRDSALAFERMHAHILSVIDALQLEDPA